MYKCMCNWVTMLYSRKLTGHCKPDLMEKKTKIIIYKKVMGQCKSRSKKVVSRDTSLFRKQEKSQMNNIILHLKQPGK